ncbi:type II toxin-antitoxin system ParD family antitoxin [Sphingomonas qilianensis]|uniref:Type II toxin-antitoxin system ParD family antitoxin n=1 Tax=Sphingomonas qilianensis TaxID=1736690 RepID=A0ABU9XPK6_9SPHN
MTDGIDLGDESEATLDRLVATGRYGTRDDVLREGIRRVAIDAARWARFEMEIQKGLDDIDAGRVYPAEEVFAELKAKYLAMAAEERSAACK